MQPFDAPANHQKTPAFIAGHVIQGKTRERRQRHDQAIEKIQQLAEIRIFGFQAQGFALQFHQGLPVLPGKLAAHL
ncbi:hypothetical protein D3C86_1386130 [compost metagenome]